MTANTIASLAALEGVTTASGVAVDRSSGEAGGGTGTSDAGRVLPVRAELDPVLPWPGLRRGSTVAVHGSISLLYTLLAEATHAGSWAVLTGLPEVGLAAAAEAGVEVSRMAAVPSPGEDVAEVLAALLDGFDLVVAGTERLSPHSARRLADRARHRGAVLLPVYPPGSEQTWPGADLRLDVVRSRWFGTGEGHGHLQSHEITVRACGRGAAGRVRDAVVQLPGSKPGCRASSAKRGSPRPEQSDRCTAMWAAG